MFPLIYPAGSGRATCGSMLAHGWCVGISRLAVVVSAPGNSPGYTGHILVFHLATFAFGCTVSDSFRAALAPPSSTALSGMTSLLGFCGTVLW